MAKKKIKIKAKAKKGITKVKAMFTSLMADKEEAEKKKVAVEYISHIIAKYNDAVVYEVTTSGFMSENPLIKFQFKGGKKGDKLIMTITDNHGKTSTKKQKIK